MSDPNLRTVPVSLIRSLLATAREGLNPLVPWSESRERMDRAGMEKRGEALREIEEQLEPLAADPS
jgi:hypothetical protein